MASLAETKLSLLEKHSHEAPVTWSEGRVRLAKHGFCDQHPHVQLRKKRWLGFKEKRIRDTCHLCDEEHALKMEYNRIQIEAARQSLRSQGESAAPTQLALPQGIPAGHLPLKPTPIQQPSVAAAAAHPQPHSETSQLLVEDLAISRPDTRLARFMAASSSGRPHQSASCRSLAAALESSGSLPERSTSCRAILCEIPENEEEEEEECKVEIDGNDSVSGYHSDTSSLSYMDLPFNRIGLRRCPQEKAPQGTVPDPPTSPRSRQRRPVPDPPTTTSPECLETSIRDLLVNSEPDDIVRPRAQAVPIPMEVVEDCKPPANETPAPKKMPAPKTMEQIKEEEKQRKKVGAIAGSGARNTLRELTEAAKYSQQSQTSITDVKDSPTAQPKEVTLPEDPVKDYVNKLKWKCKHAHEVQQDLHELQALCQSSEDHQEAVVMGEGLSTVIEKMKIFGTHAGVQEEACWVLGTLACENDDHKQLIAEAGGLIAIVASMTTLADHAGFQETACEVVTYLTEGHLLNKIAVCELGGVKAITNAMERHISNGRVQEKGCAALGDLALGNPTQITESGGIAAMFAAMMEHKYDEGLQQTACAALGNLAAGNDTAKFLIAQAGGIGFVLATLHNHRNAASVQESSCFALQSLVFNSPENKMLLVESGAIPELLTLLKKSRDVAVMEAIFDTFLILVQNCKGAKDALAGFGCVPVLASILESDSVDVSIQKLGCRVLANLSHNHDKNKTLIAAQGGITAILTCMIDRAENAGLVECACKALTSLTVNDENKVKLADAYGTNYIVGAMRNHQDHPRIQESGCQALMNLAYYENIREMILECNGVETILTAMENHLDNVTIQEKACGALRELAANESVESLLAESYGIDLILVALKNHEGHTGLLRNACGALKRLSFDDENGRQTIAISIDSEAVFTAIEDYFLNGEESPSDDCSQGSGA